MAPVAFLRPLKLQDSMQTGSRFLKTIKIRRCSNPRVIYGGVEQGGVIKSIDGGKAWSPDHEHVDKVSIGSRWIARDRMCCSLLRATACFSVKTEHFVGEAHRRIHTSCNDPSARSDDCFCRPAHEVGEHGRIIRNRDGGENWELASDGLKLPMDDMVEVFVSDPRLPDTVFAICSEGRLLYSNVRKSN